MEDGVDNSLPQGNLEDEEGDRQSKINISDVIEVIQTTDPSFQAAVQEMGDRMFGGGVVLGSGPPQRPQTNEQPAVVTPYVKIIEQPASKALRFRYECEGRSAGSIPGVHSAPENKTFPTIEIVGYKGRAVVVVSCVTKDQPYRPHPHNLVGKDGCKKGVCTVEINSPTMTVSFSNLGIQCVKKKEIDEALRVREEIRVDPFKTGFAYRSQATSIDLNAVRLCFQVFLEKNGQIRSPLMPVVSDIIYDKKAMSDLVICKMSHCSATVGGGMEVILLCEKVTKEDISIRFFEEQDTKVVWEAQGEFVHANVHKQVAISFRTPKYRSLDIETSVKASIQLRRPSDGATSEPLPFELRPLDSDTHIKRKRQKLDGDPNGNMLRQNLQNADFSANIACEIPPNLIYNVLAMQQDQPIKLEPRDQTLSYNAAPLSNFGMYRNIKNSPSPQHHMAPTPSPPLQYHHMDYQQAYAPVQMVQPMGHSPHHLDPQLQHNPNMNVHQLSPVSVHDNWSLSPNPDMAGPSGMVRQLQPVPVPQPGNESHPSLSFLDMDSHTFTPLNSTDLANILGNDDRNLTDSFTKLTTSGHINDY